METPSQEIFDKMKQAAIQIWSSYDDTFGYASEKIEIVNSLDNIQDNAMVFFRMFDHHNQHIFRTLIDGASYFYIQENL